MDATNFAYWLQGFFEVSDAKTLDKEQVQIIKDHLNLVFNKVTPNRNELPKEPTLQGGSAAPIEFDLLPKTYCSSSSTLGKNSTCGIGVSYDLEELHTKKIC
jgi:hypothetical protein